MDKNKEQDINYARKLIEATLDPLITIDINGKIMDVNDAMVNATEKVREKLIGTDFITYFIEKEKAQAVYKEIFTEGFVLNTPLTIIDFCSFPLMIPAIYLCTSSRQGFGSRFSLPFTAKTT